MIDDIPAHAIPTRWAVYLCEEICRETQKGRFNSAKTRCARCMELFPMEVTRRGFARQADNRGCPFINARDAHYYWAFHSKN